MHDISLADTAEDLAWGQTWPSRQRFRELAKTRRVIPVVKRVLADELSALGVYRQLAHGPHGSFILESAEHDGSWGRWSFVGASGPGAIVTRDLVTSWQGECPAGALHDGTFLDVVQSALHTLKGEPIPGLPPLTGALVGSLGWGLLPEWEPTLRAHADREVDVPDASLCLATQIAAIDHSDGSVWLISTALNFDGSDKRVDEAYENSLASLSAMSARLASPISPAVLGVRSDEPEPTVRHRTKREDFEASVEAAKKSIRDGDAFQIVLSQRLDVDSRAQGLDVYRVLRTVNPSPYMFYMALPSGTGELFEVIGSSPETLVRREKDRVWTYPIAGSRPRGRDAAQDRELAQGLLRDPKELSEHVMLVDLARNDLSKVCVPETVEVSTLMEIKRFSHIQHISSTVTGVLREDVDSVDCLVATFPAGTLSGAPKPRAIELIDSYEPAARGVYGGVVGYFDFSGDADWAIAIRTASVVDGVASVQAGAGIVADSVAATEYEETRNKAAAALQSVVIASTLADASSTASDDSSRSDDEPLRDR
ncbi:chorismate-binding protein [Schaalia sp. ZJ405]|uniref:chorismate-binding protein n=1 Tax=Schaalia sp. ZJ405 TaxID=2709403 RepID=UPI0013EA4B2C|nr:chorismate-binding protein [Schaalia sp. ZJ405]QPK82248.1 chorismate-binding protein [Schaalia sp. ZJ405]